MKAVRPRARAFEPIHVKDEVLDRLAAERNVAQFVSFAPAVQELEQRHCRLLGLAPNHVFAGLREALEALLARSPEASVNVRSFEPGQPRSRDFVYGLKSVDDAEAAVRRLGTQGLFTIVNETIDVMDGGVSGVVQGGHMEFAPDDTPRCVEKPGTALLPFDLGRRLLTTVYGFEPRLDVGPRERVEFSLHPLKRGWRGEHIVFWEAEEVEPAEIDVRLSWPNRFSRHVGDKAYGLLVADLVGLPVPRTTVVARRVAPFSFGTPTGTAEVWLRTAPREQMPGLFTTRRGWSDPFRLLPEEDPGGDAIASVLAQESVAARHAGALVELAGGDVALEGVEGFGDAFMQGRDRGVNLPPDVRRRVRTLHRKAARKLGPVRFEWADDGRATWILQLHVGRTASTRRTVVPGEASRWHPFRPEEGLPQLRELLSRLGPGDGIAIHGDIGLTSHIADLLRRAARPSRIVVGD